MSIRKVFCEAFFFVMPGLVPGIHDLTASRAKDVDGRDKPGHDGTDARRRRPNKNVFHFAQSGPHGR
jgi:hypothetical protein